MTHSLINTWAVGDILTSAQLNQLAADDVTSVDKTGDTITGAIVFSATSTLSTLAGCASSFAGTCAFSGAVGVTSSAVFTGSALLDIGSGCTCNFDSGSTCTFDAGATVTFGAATTFSGIATFNGALDIGTTGSIALASGATFATVAGATCSFAGTCAFSAAVAVTSSFVYTSGALCDIGNGATLNVDSGGAVTLDAGAVVSIDASPTLTGILRLANDGQIQHKWQFVSGSAYTFDTSSPLSDEHVIVQNSSGGVYTVTLPAASSLSGRVVFVSDGLFNAGTHSIQIVCQGSDNFGRLTGVTTQQIGTNGSAIRLISDGLTGWYNT